MCNTHVPLPLPNPLLYFTSTGMNGMQLLVPKRKMQIWKNVCTYIFDIYVYLSYTHTHLYMRHIYDIYIHIYIFKTYKLYTMSFIYHIPWDVKRIPQFTLVRDISLKKIIPTAFSSPGKMLPFSLFVFFPMFYQQSHSKPSSLRMPHTFCCIFISKFENYLDI